MDWQSGAMSSDIEDRRGDSGGGGGVRLRRRRDWDRRLPGAAGDQPCDRAQLPRCILRRWDADAAGSATAADARGERRGRPRCSPGVVHAGRRAEDLDADLSREGLASVQARQAGAVPRGDVLGLRNRAGSNRAVLLPGRSEGLYRPGLLGRPEALRREYGRLRAGVCDRA